LGSAVVADRLADGLDAATQRCLGHDAAVPDALDDLVLGDDSVAVLEQLDQKSKTWGSTGTRFPFRRTSYASVSIEHSLIMNIIGRCGPGDCGIERKQHSSRKIATS
jgi:hypothetical protein